MRQIPLAIGPAPLHTFDGFVPGANAAALAHLRGLAGAIPHAATHVATPVYLWGPRGTGKTHLLCALAAAAQARGLRTGWFSGASPLPWVIDEQVTLLNNAKTETKPYKTQADNIDALVYMVLVDAASRRRN